MPRCDFNKVALQGKMSKTFSEKLLFAYRVSVSGKNISFPGNLVYVLSGSSQGCFIKMKQRLIRKYLSYDIFMDKASILINI